MKLEPIIQSEVSQIEKHQRNILMHIYGIQKDGNDDPHFVLTICLFVDLVFTGLGLCCCPGFSLVAASGGPSPAAALWWLFLLRSRGSRHAGFSSCSSLALGHGLSACDTRAQLLQGMWGLLRPGTEPVSPALVGRVFTIESPGSSPHIQPLLKELYKIHKCFSI